MSLGTLNGNTISHARVQLGAHGLWWGDVTLTEPVELSGAVTLTLGGITGACYVRAGGAFEGSAAYRLVGGAGGWARDVPRKSYRDDQGVRVSSVLSDIARAVGETLAGAPDTRIGPNYTRAQGPAHVALNGLTPRAWYVGLDGVTRFGARPTVAYTGDAPRTRVDRAAGVVEIATEDLAGLVPGVVVDGSAPATDVEYVLTPERLTARVYAAAHGRSRRLEAWRRLLDAADPWRAYRCAYDFRVVTQSGERLNVQPVRTATGMPDLQGVPVCPGMAGLRADVTPGEIVKLAFADGDPSRPYVFAHEEQGGPGWMPLFIELGAAPTLGVARLTDAVVAGPFAGTITLASTRVKAGL